MTEKQEENPFDIEETELEVPKALRDAYKRQKDENETLRQQVADYEKSKRESSINQFVKDKGLPEKVVGLIGDSDPETWYSEYGDVFAGETEPPKEPNVPPEQVEQIKEVANVQPGTFTPGTGEELDSKLEHIYSADVSEAERYSQLRAMGAMV